MRIDAYPTSAGYVTGREKAKELIAAGGVALNGKTVRKPSETVTEQDSVTVDDSLAPKYVGRGGLKLEAALHAFSLDVTGLTCVDIGASTGGFTDCLLMNGARRVFAVDCGSGQLAPKLLADARVVPMENFNARTLDRSHLGEACDLAVMDVSFISQTLLYGAVTRVLKPQGLLVSLIKPQFEVGRAKLGKHGIVRDEAARLEAMAAVTEAARRSGLVRYGLIGSPIPGGDGNAEYLALFQYQPDKTEE